MVNIIILIQKKYNKLSIHMIESFIQIMLSKNIYRVMKSKSVTDINYINIC